MEVRHADPVRMGTVAMSEKSVLVKLASLAHSYTIGQRDGFSADDDTEHQ